MSHTNCIELNNVQQLTLEIKQLENKILLREKRIKDMQIDLFTPITKKDETFK